MFNSRLKEKVAYLEDRVKSLEGAEVRLLRRLHEQEDAFQSLLKYHGLDYVGSAPRIVAIPRTPQE